jgi:hypothetical protein
MKNVLKAVIFMTAMSASLAQAQSYAFSYTFSSGDVITGSFTGDLNTTTTLFSNVANVYAALDGVPFVNDAVIGSLDIVAWNSSTQSWDDTLTPQISTNAGLNNFSIADNDPAKNVNTTNYFQFINDANNGQEVLADNNNGSPVFALDTNSNGAVNSAWTVTAVPEPGLLSMLVSGLGFLATKAHRRSGVIKTV